jgi:epoxyqueuosine reductase
MNIPAQRLKTYAVELGFNLIGLTRAEPSPTMDAYLRWIEAGMHGAMGYMARPDRIERRRDPRVILPTARSMIVVGVDYRSGAIPEAALSDPSRGRIAAYAWGLDYHEVITPRLEQLAAWIQREAGGAIDHRAYVDTGAILERSHAQQAGMGFIGKNTMLIHPRRGSTFFLGEMMTALEFDDYDTPIAESMCGRCTRCLAACPTDAFPRPFVLDARRCISALTIEHKGWIDPGLRPLMGNWIFGCDVCQDVCPWQRFAPVTEERLFHPADWDRAAPPLLDLLALDEAGFTARFAGSPVMRIRRDRLVRNACVAAGNWADPHAIPALTVLLDDPAAIVRGHAAWALMTIDPIRTRPLLEARLRREADPDARAEINRLLNT